MDSREALIERNLKASSATFLAAPGRVVALPTAPAASAGKSRAQARGSADQVEEELKKAEKAGVRIVTLLDPDYPEGLKNIPDPPSVLYIKGTVWKEDALAVGIVGTRSASRYGLATAHQLAFDLAKSGVTVVSGLAEGIDGAAHEGALEANGRTFAVLGHGLNHLYPAHHRGLADRTAESGALISEFPMEAKPDAWRFPRRNRVIAGLSLGVVVVEAPIKSGALITAREALEQGREVFAVPGPVSSERSRGCHALIKDGAKLVETAQDIWEGLGAEFKEKLKVFKPDENGKGEKFPAGFSREEAAVYRAIPLGESVAVEALAQETAFQPSKLLPLLTQLELDGWIRQVPGQGYCRLGNWG